MGAESKQVDICLVCISMLVLASLTLMAVSSLGGGHLGLARWSILLAIVAATWAVVYTIGKAKRAIIKGVARELALHTRNDEGLPGLRVLP